MNERYILSKSNDNNMNVKIGNRVKLVKTNDPYTDLAKNEYIGTVYDINKVSFDGGFTQIWCKFENGSNFAIVPETGDQYEVLK